METGVETPDALASTPETTIERLGKLLALLKITEAYYVDDYNKIDEFPIISVIIKRIFTANIERLKVIFGEQVTYEVPSDDVFIESLSKLWEELDESLKKTYTEKIHAEEVEGFNLKDYSRTKELSTAFPEQSLHLVTPDEWETTILPDLLGRPEDGDNFLLLFDQDLTKADGKDFKDKTCQGQNLIANVVNSSIGHKVHCALITHLISTTSEELGKRDSIIKEITDAGGHLGKKDFLALTKERITTPEHLCDGIKRHY